MKTKQENQPQKTKSPHRFRALDAVIILLILTAVIGVYFRYNLLDAFTKKQDLEEYTVTFSIENIRHTTPGYFNYGDRVYLADTQEELGVLINASNDSEIVWRRTPASEMVLNEEQQLVEFYYPENTRVSVQGRLQCSGTYSEDGGFLLNGSRYLSAGQTLAVQTELVSVEILIQSIELSQS